MSDHNRQAPPRGGHSSRIVQKKRDVLVATFNSVVLNGRYEQLGVRELARKAGVGRSTFYEYFNDKLSLLIESMYPLLSVLTEAVVCDSDSRLPWVLAHFEEQRQNAIALFNAEAERKAIETGLARLIAQQLPPINTILPRHDVASALSRMTIGLIADWLTAERRVDRNDFASALANTAKACRRALTS